MSTNEPYSDRLRRVLRRWDPRGIFVGDKRAYEAVSVLKTPQNHTDAQLAQARWTCDVAVHPVLEQPIPSSFRNSAFMPVTAILSLGMVSSSKPLGVLACHWLYQSHSAATRYCNYADTARPLDGQRMLAAYGLSTGVACGIALAAVAAVRRAPSLRALGLIAPHSAVCAAGALSTYLNNEADLAHGVEVTDAAGAPLGVSRRAAEAGVMRAAILQNGVVPLCSLLLPVLAMRGLVVPRLWKSHPDKLWPISAALVAGGVCVATPAAAAAMPAVVSLPVDDLEPEVRAAAKARGVDTVYSSRVLY